MIRAAGGGGGGSSDSDIRAILKLNIFDVNFTEPWILFKSMHSETILQ